MRVLVMPSGKPPRVPEVLVEGDGVQNGGRKREEDEVQLQP